MGQCGKLQPHDLRRCGRSIHVRHGDYLWQSSERCRPAHPSQPDRMLPSCAGCAVTLEDLRSVRASRFHRFHLVWWSSQFRIMQITDAGPFARGGEFIFRKSRFATLRPIPDIKEYLDRCSIELLEKLREREALITCSKKRCTTPTCHCSSVAGFAADGNCPAEQMAFACSAVADICV